MTIDWESLVDAAINGQTDVVRSMEHYVNWPDSQTVRSLIYRIIDIGHFDIVNLLSRHTTLPNSETMLKLVADGDIKTLEYLFKERGNWSDAKRAIYKVPTASQDRFWIGQGLLEAVANNNMEMVKLLIDNVESAVEQIGPAIKMATEKGFNDLALYLIDHYDPERSEQTTKTTYGYDALKHAADHKQYDLFYLLAEKVGAEVE